MWRAALLGVVAGMRSQLPGALLAWRSTTGQFPHDIAGPGGALARRSSVPLTAMAAAGEMVGDKLARTPSRLEEGPFLGRLALGAAAGSGVASAFGGSRVTGAVLGAAGAALGSVAGNRAREAAVRRTGVADHVWGLVEDGLAITLGLLATRAALSSGAGRARGRV
ncbi:MAG TPA: hypothetical protein VK875_10340 [Euzebyales bacterium]|nr:hypothetical protein [Euzebyales bacterium]